MPRCKGMPTPVREIPLDEMTKLPDMNAKFRYIVFATILATSIFMHFKHFPKDLVSIHVWRQTQTQSTIINFYEEDMNILNPRRNDRGDTEGIFRMEFPLMQWLVAVQYKILGNNIIISRIFMFITGLFSILGIYALLNALFKNTTIAIIGAWAFNFSPSFFYYTINPLPDNLALCFAIWGIASFFIYYNNQKMIYLVLSGLSLSLAALCKLPFIIYYIVPATYLLISLYKNGFTKKLLTESVGALWLAILPLAWYVSVISTWQGNPIVKGILDNQVSSSSLIDYLLHNLISTLPELLLNYGSVLFFIAGFYYLVKHKSYKNEKFIILLSLCVAALAYYFFEANAIAKIHDYYLFPFYPLLFILVAYGAFYFYQSNPAVSKPFTLLLLIILPLTCYLRMQNRWDLNAPGFNRDLLLHTSALRNAVPKDALVVAGNDDSHFIFFYYIDKKGWGFDNDNLTPDRLQGMIKQGAQYLYTDSKNIYENKEIIPYLGQLVSEQGTVKIFKLKSSPGPA